MEKATVAHHQQANETREKQRRTYKNTATMEEALNNKSIESVENTYISELCNKYMGFVGVKAIGLIHHQMYRYGKIIETDLK